MRRAHAVLLLPLLAVVLAGCADGGTDADGGGAGGPTTAPTPAPTHTGSDNFLSVMRSDGAGRRVLDVDDVRDPQQESEVRRLAAAAASHGGSHEEPMPADAVADFLEALHRDWEAANPGGAPETRSNPIAVRVAGGVWLFAWAAVVPA